MGDSYERRAKHIAFSILKDQHSSGAYPASPTFPMYQYGWFRDGSFTADAMSSIGEIASAERFFDWCRTVVVAQRDAIYSGETLDTRYNYDGSRPEGEWASFQLDGYGVLLWALKQHNFRHNRSLEPYSELIATVQYYLSIHWNEPCYDWWEERMGSHSATLACIYAGLHAFDHPKAAAVKNAIHFDEERTDASLMACLFFDAVTADAFAPTLSKIEAKLVSEDGGVFRHAEDTYYGGGQWPVVTALLGVCYAKLGRNQEARQKLDWCLRKAQDNGWLPEQESSRQLHPDTYESWVHKWGLPANPLLWSQAMTVKLYCELDLLSYPSSR
jgi:GH15 family glucan-1,4-alpha-glucosidase